MSYPSEYENAINNLKALRKNIESVFIGGRIKALLEASKETLQKYYDILSGKSITASLEGNINRYMMILNGNPLYLPRGLIAQAKLKYTGDVAGYPKTKTGELKVDIRDLPVVNPFIEKFASDISLIEEGHEAMWGQLFVLQADNNQFGTDPDAENAFFDYYRFTPLGREKFEADLSDGIGDFGSYNKIKGECTVLAVSVLRKDTNKLVDYVLYVFLDCDLLTSEGVHKHFPFAVINPETNASNPEATFIIAGKRMKTNDTGLFVGDVRDGQLMGFTKTHNTVSGLVTKTLYSEMKTLVIEVDGAEYGCTDPPAGVYSKYASEPISITATPYGSNVFKGWVFDGVGIPPSENPLNFTMIRNRHVKAIFRPELFQTIFPNEDIQVDDCYAKIGRDYVTPKYQAIDEGVPDGWTSYIYIYDDVEPYAMVKFGLTDPSIPSSSVIEKVEVVAVARTSALLVGNQMRIGIETYGAIYLSDPITLFFDEWTEHKLSFDKNPYTQQLWTVKELKDLRLVITSRHEGGGVYCTLAHVDIYYS